MHRAKVSPQSRHGLSTGTRASRQLLSTQQALLPKPHLEAGLRLDVLLTCRDDALRQLALLQHYRQPNTPGDLN